MFNSTNLMIGIIVSAIGTGYFIYGKKDQNFTVLLSGIILMIYPYFIINIYYSISIAIILMIIPFIKKHYF